MIKLKPCPFCGGSASVKRASREWKDAHIADEFVVKCMGCGARLPLFRSDIWTDDAGVVHIDANGAVDAMEAWNRRVSDGDHD